MIGLVSSPETWIYHFLSLILNNQCESIENIMHNKTSTQHISCNSSPNSIIFISASSVNQDLSNHGNKMKKGDDRFPTCLKSSVMKQCIQGSSSSRSPSSTLLWSLMHKLTLEKAWILLNFRKPSSWTCTCGARIYTKFFNPSDDSSSMMHCEHDYARILMSYVKKIQVWIERIFGGKWNSRSRMWSPFKFC